MSGRNAIAHPREYGSQPAKLDLKMGKGGKGKKGASAAASSGAAASKEKGGGTTSVEVRHILCEKHGKAMQALEKLRAAYNPPSGKVQTGLAAWTQIAGEFSEDKARSGGNLGWMTRGSMVGDFQDKAFTMPVRTCVCEIVRALPLVQL
eukprot:TRINITY_DN8532_c0_g1_i3.p2 TRINITY_DN8532_c0_g1~~TRINITY_DN8532_c0_g1_i3.p2  ORF type:complete len:149 (+),score=14.61 TRINITY_DN8532_c0_g1_i3:91-537(+)